MAGHLQQSEEFGAMMTASFAATYVVTQLNQAVTISRQSYANGV